MRGEFKKKGNPPPSELFVNKSEPAPMNRITQNLIRHNLHVERDTLTAYKWNQADRLLPPPTAVTAS